MSKANALLIASLLMLASVLPIFLWNHAQPEKAQTDLADVKVPSHNDTIWAGKYYGFLAQGMWVQGSAKQIVTGDLNGDGFPDIAVLSQPDGPISLFFWNNTMKNFSLTPNVVFAQFTQPKLIAIGSINEDALQDLVIVWHNTADNYDHLDFLIQESPGIFSANGQFPTRILDSNPIALLIGQFDAIPGNDIAVIGRGTTGLGHIDMLFYSPSLHHYGPVIHTIDNVGIEITSACSILNATSYIGPSELAVGNATGTIKVYRQPLNKTTPTSYVIQSPGEIVAMGSGNLSASAGYSPGPGLLSMTKDPNRTYIFKPQSGTYDSSRNDTISLSFAPVAIALTDFDHNGFTDLAIVSNNPISMTKTYTRNTASGSPWPESLTHVMTSIGNASSIAAADFDNDGQIDISESSGSNSSTSPIAAYFKILSKPISPSDASLMIPVSVDSIAFAVGRVNSNSDQLIVLDRNSASAKVYNMNGGILTQNWSFQDSGGAPVAMAIGKLNGDSHDDLVIVDASDNYLRAYLGGSFSHTESFSHNLTGRPTGVALGDTNGDGVDEVVVTTADSKIDIFASTGSTFSLLQTISSPTPPAVYSSPMLADMNDDGRLDIIAGVMNNSTIELFNQLPGGNFPATCNASISTLGVPPSWIAVGDFDWNGLLDIASGSEAQSKLVINYQKPLGSFSADKKTTIGRVSGLTAGDFTDRGRMDLLLTMAKASMGALYMSVNDTGIADYPNETVLLSGNSTSALAWDYNSDGRKDIWILASGSKAVNIWFQLNQPPSVFIDPSFPGTEGKPIAFSVRVIDGVSEIGNHTVAWEFGDGTTATVVHNYSTTHIYANNGTYQVNVTVTDPGGLSASASSLAVIADTSPVISINVSPATPLEGQIATLRANVTAWDPITRYAWRVDGTIISNSTTSNSTTHRFTNGTHLVEAIVWDTDSLNSSTKSIFVIESPPTARIVAPAAANAGVNVVFTADVSDPSNVDPVTWFEWDFNYDSASFNPAVSSSSPTASHVFTTPGGDKTYAVALRVNDSDGSHNITAGIIAIDGKITANFSDVVSYRRNPEDTSNVTFDAAIILTLYPDTYTVAKWDWGDGTSTQNSGSPVQSQDLLASHRFSADRNYNVSLLLVDDGGITCYLNTTLKMIHPQISVENLTGDIPHLVMRTGTPIQFEATAASGPIAFVNWSLDGGAWTSLPLSSTSAYLAATPGSWAEGTHQIILRVQDSEGNAVSTVIPIVIDNTPPTIQISSLNIQSVIGDSVNITLTVTDVNLNSMMVFLNSTEGGNQFSLIQMHYAGNGSFWVVIPSPSRTGTFEFNVTATDLAGNTVTTTTPIKVTIVNGFWTDAWPFIALAAVLAAIAFIGLTRIEEMMAVDETFVIYNDGRLISHQTRRLTPDRDSDILSGMFVAVQEFVKDSFKEDTLFDLRKLEFGGRTVLVEKGKKIYLAVVLQGRQSKLLTKKMQEVTKEIEAKFQKPLEKWEGDIAALRGVKDITNRLNTRLISRIRGRRAGNN